METPSDEIGERRELLSRLDGSEDSKELDDEEQEFPLHRLGDAMRSP
jgi:hypothetical protein